MRVLRRAWTRRTVCIHPLQAANRITLWTRAATFSSASMWGAAENFWKWKSCMAASCSAGSNVCASVNCLNHSVGWLRACKIWVKHIKIMPALMSTVTRVPDCFSCSKIDRWSRIVLRCGSPSACHVHGGEASSWSHAVQLQGQDVAQEADQYQGCKFEVGIGNSADSKSSPKFKHQKINPKQPGYANNAKQQRRRIEV